MKTEKILILGLGGIGYYLARRLSNEGHLVTVIESDPVVIEKAAAELDVRLIKGSATDFQCWKAAEASQMHYLIAATNSDAVNLLAALVADKFNIEQKIVRLGSIAIWENQSPISQGEFKIDLLIRPEELAAREISRFLKMRSGNVLIDIGDSNLQILAIHVERQSALSQMLIKDIAYKYYDYNFSIVCVARDIETIIPGGGFKILPNDHIFLLTSSEEMPKLMKLVGIKEEVRNKVMIIGGGQIGSRLAELLQQSFSVRLLEVDEKRSEELSYLLNKTECLHGDGSDRKVLVEAGILDMDTVIAATGNNENNIMTSVLAKQLIRSKLDELDRDIGKTIAHVKREDYLVLASAMGIDIAVNKKILAANHILRYIRRENMIAAAHLHGCDAEVVEIIADPKTPITKSTIAELGVLNGKIMVGAVFQNDSWKIVRGDSRIEAGNKVVCICKPNNLRLLQELFLS